MHLVNAYDTGDMIHLVGDFARVKKITLLTTRAQMLGDCSSFFHV